MADPERHASETQARIDKFKAEERLAHAQAEQVVAATRRGRTATLITYLVFGAAAFLGLWALVDPIRSIWALSETRRQREADVAAIMLRLEQAKNEEMSAENMKMRADNDVRLLQNEDTVRALKDSGEVALAQKAKAEAALATLVTAYGKLESEADDRLDRAQRLSADLEKLEASCAGAAAAGLREAGVMADELASGIEENRREAVEGREVAQAALAVIAEVSIDVLEIWVIGDCDGHRQSKLGAELTYTFRLNGVPVVSRGSRDHESTQEGKVLRIKSKGAQPMTLVNDATVRFSGEVYDYDGVSAPDLMWQLDAACKREGSGWAAADPSKGLACDDAVQTIRQGDGRCGAAVKFKLGLPS